MYTVDIGPLAQKICATHIVRTRPGMYLDLIAPTKSRILTRPSMYGTKRYTSKLSFIFPFSSVNHFVITVMIASTLVYFSPPL